MKRRRLLKAYQRIKRLPKGYDFFKYCKNKLYTLFLKITKSTKIAHPSSIMLEVTNHCNLKCITCPREYEYGENMDKGYMKFEVLKKIVDDAYPYVDSIGLTGLGETLLYKHLIDAVDYIKNKNKGIVISISTNAHLPNSVEILKQLIGKIDTIQISIDGIGNGYNSVRKKGDYSFFFSNVKELSDYYTSKNTTTDIMFNMVVIKENYSQMADVVKLAGELKIGYVNIQTMNLAGTPTFDKNIYELYKTPDFKRKLTDAKEIAKKLSIELSTFKFEKEGCFKKCMLPWGHFYISWDGWLAPCCAKPFPKILNFGNVIHHGLMNTLNSKNHCCFRKKWHQNETPDFCRNCHMIEIPKIQI